MPTVVVTGGNKGLGLAQTRAFLSAGWRVRVVARGEGDLADLASGDVALIRHDLSDWRDTAYLDRIAAAGRVDALVNNAGAHLKKPVWDVEPDELERVLDLNVKAAFAASGRFVALCRAAGQGGAIVNIASMAGLMALPAAAAYVTSKTAVIGLTRSVAVDAAPFGIRCNAVCPGFIDTDMTRAVLERDPARRERIERRIPGGRFGPPEAVAGAVLFLASDASLYINGVALPVDNGYAVGF